MSENVSVELSKPECELVLRGLRNVRSALMLSIHDPDPEVDSKRDSELTQIAALTERLAGAASSLETSEAS